MPDPDDYTLGVADVSKRLNKSIRTVHRYKDSGRLTFVMGASQGNPLYFSQSEVEALAQELYPHMPLAGTDAKVDPQFWDRVERVERMLAVLEANPTFEEALTRLAEPKPAPLSPLELVLAELVKVEKGSRVVDVQALGRLLSSLGALLQGK